MINFQRKNNANMLCNMQWYGNNRDIRVTSMHPFLTHQSNIKRRKVSFQPLLLSSFNCMRKMDDIELSNQASKRSYTTSIQLDELSTSNTTDHLSARSILKQDSDNDDDITVSSHSRLSGDSSINMPPNTNDIEQKKTFSERIKAKIPPIPLIRAVVKASFAVLIALIITFVDRSRNAIGQGIILVPIGTILHFPIRPLGTYI